MISLSAFNTLLIVMALTAVVVFISLHFVSAGYGMMYTRRWGPSVNNRLGWVMMEAPVFIAMCILWALSPRQWDTTPLVIFCLFQAHYFQRSFIFPMLIQGKNRMPLSIILMGVLFNLINALMQGGWIFYLSPEGMYSPEWLCTPQFIIGTLIFIAGMAINIHSDHIIRHLRRPSDTRHYIPRGGMFPYVSSAHYFGEFVDWTGFAILTWAWAGAVFALWTFANLAPRARRINRRYAEEFGEEFTRLNLRAIIPFIY
ncbi:MAG: 3-oxo-5-alpha-steroid 4-dehydrogenase [Muribaculaceae bacterium]|nr:3-oxo-5-alpha-steroid 4-dehydrogenase [Muribaculaceae bacterium]